MRKRLRRIELFGMVVCRFRLFERTLSQPARQLRVLRFPRQMGPGGTIGDGGSMEFPTMTVTNQSPTWAGSVTVSLFQEVPPMITGRSLVLYGDKSGPKSRVSLAFERGAKAVKFGIGSTTRTPAKVWCYNNSGTVISYGSTPEFGAAAAVWAEFLPREPYENELITKVVIEEQYGAYVDNFTLS